MAVSKRLRFEIFRRDSHTCRYCGATAPNVTLQIDHVIPVTLGGTDDSSNLVTACRECNSGKSSTPLGASTVEDINVHSHAWEDAKLVAADEQASAQAHLDYVCDALERTWTYSKPQSWRTSIRQLLGAGLDLDVILEMAEVAQNAYGVKNSRWSYFCGCCWKRVRQIEDRAAELTAAQSQEVDETTRFIEQYWEETNERHIMYSGGYPMPFCECPGDYCGDPLCKYGHAQYMNGWMDSYETAKAKHAWGTEAASKPEEVERGTAVDQT